MPVHAVRRKGKIIGYQWGRNGKIYRGKGAKRRAGRQGKAAYSHGYRKRK